MLLQVEHVRVCYDGVPALQDASLHVDEGEIVALVGSNGAGKSTLVRSISGLLHPESGTIAFCGERIDHMPAHRVLEKGIAHVPEGRHIFGRMSVRENLLAGAYSERVKAKTQERMDLAFTLFPILKKRQDQRGSTLSGGEQQMLAIARGLMCGPKLLILDEPSLGIAPNLALEIIEDLLRIRDSGTTILLIEQAVHDALRIADRGYVLQTGQTVAEGRGADLLASEMIRVAYLGM